MRLLISELTSLMPILLRVRWLNQAHLRYMNHGAEFYALIARYLPDWKTRRALLRA
jgi:hypothetical protein